MSDEDCVAEGAITSARFVLDWPRRESGVKFIQFLGNKGTEMGCEFLVHGKSCFGFCPFDSYHGAATGIVPGRML